MLEIAGCQLNPKLKGWNLPFRREGGKYSFVSALEMA